MKSEAITVYLPDTKGVEVSPYGSGNLKLGFGIFTYSRLAGAPAKAHENVGGTCPGSTVECEAICYAKRIAGVTRATYHTNSLTAAVPPIPAECKLLRLHVSGDFDTADYIANWVARLLERPDVTAWAYTRSWRVPALLPHLEVLRALPNIQLFASMDPSCKEMPPTGWRRSWIHRDFDKAVEGPWPMEDRLIGITQLQPSDLDGGVPQVLFNTDNQATMDGAFSYVCPEETGKKPNCQACGYCFEGQKHDVTFLEH